MFDQPLGLINRYREILAVIMRHGLGVLISNPVAMVQTFSDKENPAFIQSCRNMGTHLRQACQELGPAFIKIGQIASTRSDLLSVPIAQELAKLQDQVTPIEFSDIQRIVEWNYGKRLNELFLHFQAQPLAVASIGQVHYAVLRTGEPVAVKILKPGITRVVQTDLEIFQKIVNQITQRTDWSQRYPLQAMLNEFAGSIRQELDFRNEADHMEKMRRILRKNSQIVIPKLYSELSNEHILVTQYLEGEKIDEWLAHNPSPEDCSKIAEDLSKAFMQQILGHGFFHADPHPGNFLILRGNRIGLLDFGIIGNLNYEKRGQLVSLLNSMAQGQVPKTIRTISKMGVIPPGTQLEALGSDISQLRKNYLRENGEKNYLGEITNQFFQIIHKHRIYFPADFIMVGKSLIFLEGITKHLDSRFSIINMTKPYLNRLLVEQFLPRNLFSRIFNNN